MGLVETLFEKASPSGLAVFVVIAFFVYWVVARITEENAIRRLGARAPVIKSYFPFALDFVYLSVTSALRNESLEFVRDRVFGRAGAYTIETRPAGLRILFTADPQNIKALLATQFEDFGKGERLHQELKPFLGDSIFATDGKTWHDSRQLIRPSFTRDRVSDLVCFEKHVQTLLKAIANGGPLLSESQLVDLEFGDGKVVDMKDLFFRMTLDVTTEFLLGEDVKSLMRPREPFMEAFDTVQHWQNIINRTTSFRHLIYKPAYWKSIRVINEFVETYIQKTLQLSPEQLATTTKGAEGYSFLHEVASFTRDPKVIRDQVVAVLLAGRDTTAGTLSFAIYELSKRPDCVAKLRAEILDTVGRDRQPTYDNLKNMTFLKNVLNETLRMYPSVPFNIRMSLKDTTLPMGGGPSRTEPIGCPAGTPVAYSTLVMQRRRELYPETVTDSEKNVHRFPDPAIFEPDRWLHWHPKPHDYIPFNAGPRICIGQQFALTEMSYVLCRMFQKFDRLENHMDVAESTNPTLLCEITLSPAQGVKVAFRKARD